MPRRRHVPLWLRDPVGEPAEETELSPADQALYEQYLADREADPAPLVVGDRPPPDDADIPL